MLTVELFQESYRADCLRIVAENYDPTMALNCDRELSDMFSNSSFPPRFFVLKEDDEVIGLGCYTISWMDYGVYEISWINIDREHQGRGLGTFLVSRILEELHGKKARAILLFASKAVSLYERLGFRRACEISGGDHLMVLGVDQVAYQPFLASASIP
jgi:ribosomal protein S18 acetylase RimI-like enzyme